MGDDTDFNIDFLRLVECEPILYDKSVEEYKNKSQREEVWKTIANKLHMKGKHLI